METVVTVRKDSLFNKLLVVPTIEQRLKARKPEQSYAIAKGWTAWAVISSYIRFRPFPQSTYD